MKVLVSGASGLVGGALKASLERDGHQVTPLVRESGGTGVPWDPARGLLEPAGAEGHDAVVHLAGESIASGRWNDEKKARIRDSRVVGTRALVDSLISLKRPPSTLLCASAIGYYGDRGSLALDEKAAPGEGFLPEVCVRWEGACAPAEQNGIRVANLRFGVILSVEGGALAKMLLPFKLGVGGKLGDGRQYMSWISLDDVVGIIAFALSGSDLSGPVNTTAPHPVTNAEFTTTLARVLSRPAILPMPAFAARLAFGEMADALLLASTRVIPSRLQEAGYAFRHERLEGALRHILDRRPRRKAA